MDGYILFVFYSLENYIYRKIPEEFNLLKKANSKDNYSIKLNKSLYLIKAIRTYMI